jgi:hypothetical protein
LDTTGTSYSIAGYVMVCSIITLITLIFYRDRYREDLA